PFGSRGGIAFRHYFPLDGTYLIKIRLQRAYGLAIRGGAARNTIDVRLDGARVTQLTPEPKGRGGLDDAEKTVGHDLELRLPVKAGMRVVGLAFEDTRRWLPEGPGP